MEAAIPAELRARLEKVMRWRSESYDLWWNKPVVLYADRRPREMDAWELEELVSKLEDSAARQHADWLAFARCG